MSLIEPAQISCRTHKFGPEWALTLFCVDLKDGGGVNEDGTLSLEGLEILQDGIFDIVSAEYNNAYLMVSSKVQILTAILDNAMAPTEVDGDEE
eukprot:SAG11_NODE_3891_length_2163_cov_1.973837_4_plen_94_part_00